MRTIRSTADIKAASNFALGVAMAYLCQIVDLATTQQFASDTNSAESCSQLYDMLRKSPKLWSDGPVSEIVGIVYDLLHESLSLWSHPAGVGSLPEACSRKRLRSE